MKAFNYRIQTEFEIQFDDGETAKCIALEPPEKKEEMKNFDTSPWSLFSKPTVLPTKDGFLTETPKVEYHLAPEVFVSDGTPDSIVGKWVAERGGVGGIHHLAYQVDSVKATMQEWKEKGYAEFASEDVLTCPGLTQIFTKPSPLTGIIYEFIEREENGFCAENVQALMESTKDNI